MAIILLSPTTAAVASTSVIVDRSNSSVTFMASPILGATETGIIQFSADNGSTWINLVSNGLTQQLSPSDTMLTVNGSGLFRINKSATASATGIYASYGALS